ncbi:MAG: hypothetical protein ACPGGA_05915 [Balneolaceae bacterium]
MKDLSNYTYSDLFDMLTHIDQYKYPELLNKVQQELDSRREKGEVPTEIVPKIDWSVFRFRKKKKDINNAQIA